jgi:hypothetical protein
MEKGETNDKAIVSTDYHCDKSTVVTWKHDGRGGDTVIRTFLDRPPQSCVERVTYR